MLYRTLTTQQSLKISGFTTYSIATFNTPCAFHHSKKQFHTFKPVAKKGRALLVTEYFLPHWTGISQAFFYLAQNLKKQGYAVTVLTTQFNTSLPLTEKVKGIETIRSPYQLRISRTHYSFSLLIRYIKMLPSYDWVIINSPNSNILFLSLLAKLFGKKLAIYHQGDLTLPRQTGNIAMHKVMEYIFDALSIPSFLLADVTSTYTRDYAAHSRVMKHALHTFRAYIPDFVPSRGSATAPFAKKNGNA
ncbi:MAG: hypothetical protein UZ22_OP11002000839 [Microgenomates bacterium OLB23]|nr:MAG: hypothetical protein UZ22_OP11002000839 [Microgenomates bacterium OLB23]